VWCYVQMWFPIFTVVLTVAICIGVVSSSWVTQSRIYKRYNRMALSVVASLSRRHPEDGSPGPGPPRPAGAFHCGGHGETDMHVCLWPFYASLTATRAWGQGPCEWSFSLTCWVGDLVRFDRF
jgi:hypothetical protein